MPFVACGCLWLLLLCTGDLLAGPKRLAPNPVRSLWSQVAFTDEIPDFVPPPPRDEFDEVDVVPATETEPAEESAAEPLFDPEAENPGPRQEQRQLAPHGPDFANAPLIPQQPQRDYFDPGFNTDPHATKLWQVMPSGLLYHSYLAGEKESRISSVWNHDKQGRTVWENTLGARLGLLRYGTPGAYRPRGWQLDFEGGALPRVLPNTPSSILEAVDFRAGFQSTWAFDRWHIKTGYYHLSSHLGDEYVIANPGAHRYNYVRDSTVMGVTYDINNDWQTYGEFAYALGAEDGAKPIEFQYGLQYSPMVWGLRGTPFAAVNGHTRQEFGYTSSVNMQAGWQWRGTDSQHLLRVGVQYYTGSALQYSFPGGHDRLLGAGMWFDF